jgi:hypothetical protein
MRLYFLLVQIQAWSGEPAKYRVKRGERQRRRETIMEREKEGRRQINYNYF